MDRLFQLKEICSRTNRSTWLGRKPILAIDSDTGIYGFCPECGFAGRSLFLDIDSASCGNCDVSFEYTDLLDLVLCKYSDVMSLVRSSFASSEIEDDILADALNYFRFNLVYNRESDKARRYLKNRGISASSIKHFKIGFAPGRSTALTDAFVSAPEREALREQSLLISNSENNSEYDRFFNRIMFPIHNVYGRIISFGGRLFDPNQKGAKYLNGAETALFDKSNELYGLHQARKSIRETNAAIVVEGYFDVISLHQHGLKTAVATMGTSLTASHCKALFSSCKYVYLCFDGDKAGISAAMKAIDTMLPFLNNVENQVLIALLPAGEDPDSIVTNKGKKSFLKLLSSAISPVRFTVDQCKVNFSSSNIYDACFLVSSLSRLYSTNSPEIQTEILRSLIECFPRWDDHFAMSLFE